MKLRSLLRITSEVQHALQAGLPIVALESTIISHGMRYPENVETALSLEAIVRSSGCVPAHIALLSGHVCIGLEPASLDALGRAGSSAHKTSRRDLAHVLASGGMGATTVSGTMACAHAAGISVFATGGLGGVHRGGEHSLDVSADLTELGRTPVAVVCAGVKSLLDVPRTLEYLETQGVPVVTLGSSTFPTFFSPGSALPSPLRADSVGLVARQWALSRALGLHNGMVLAVPPPAAVPGVEEAIAAALQEASDQGMLGKDITPFLLARVAELTGGASLTANIALVKRNAAVAAELAVALAEEEGGGSSRGAQPGTAAAAAARGAAPSLGSQRRSFSTLRMTVVGGAVLDTLSRPLPGEALRHGTSNSGVNTQTAGGVGRNIAEVLARLCSSSSSSSAGAASGSGITLISAVGSDPAGAALLASCASAGIALVNVAPHTGAGAGCRTATYSALLDGAGELVAAVADTSILEAALTPQALLRQPLAASRAVICDANLPAETLLAVGKALLAPAAATGAATQPPPLFILEPVSTVKSLRCLPALPYAALVKPNASEAIAMAEAWRSSAGLPPLPAEATAEERAEAAAGYEGEEEGGQKEEEEEGAPDARLLAAAQTILAAMMGGSSTGSLIEGRKHVLVSLGPSGVLWLSCAPLPPQAAALCASLPFFAASAHPAVNFDFQLLPAPPTVVRKVTGAGDTLLGSLVWALVKEGVGMGQAVRYGLAGARLALQCEPSLGGGGAIPRDISAAALRLAVEDVAVPEEGYS
jgi:pseudouridine-5'-phosphate glycosidase/pseudouridine kinase